MKRSRLKSDPEKVREWQERSRVNARKKKSKSVRKAPRKALRPMSAAQRKILAKRRYVRKAVVARDGIGCYAGNRGIVPEVECASPFEGRADLELHEVVKRSRWKAGALVPANCRLLCQAHHDYTEREVEGATRAGLLARARPVHEPKEEGQ